MKHQHPYRLTQILYCRQRTNMINRLGILTQILIVMDYFFHMLENYFQFRKKKNMCHGNCLLHLVTGSTHSRIIFRTMQLYLKKIYTKICSYQRLNNFAKSLYLSTLREFSLKKNQNYRNLNKVLRVSKLVHPSHITIHSL